MRDEQRIDRILGLIKEMWMESPDQRFGQLMINTGVFKDSLLVWIKDDYDLELYLKNLLKQKASKE